jgi:hypothetical protein
LQTISIHWSTAMNRLRYDAYRCVLSSVRLGPFSPEERDLLRDAAEGFLLAQDLDSEELGELALSVVVTLDDVVSSGRMTTWTADHIKSWIDACGPTGVPVAPVPVAVG